MVNGTPLLWNSDILDTAQAGVVIIDPVDMSVVEINSVATKLLGVTKEEVIGKTCAESLLCTQWREEYNMKHPEEHICPVLLDDNGGIETTIIRKDGLVFKILRSVTSITCEDKAYLVESLVDVTKIREEEARTKALLSIMHKEFNSEDSLARFALNEAVKLTRSDVGYLHFVKNGDPIEDVKLELFVWSDNVYDMCTSEVVGHYQLDKAGIWADCIRLRKPVIHNDYENETNKKGYPEGHFVVKRHLSVPVIDEGRIVAVIGVGNKIEPYSNHDVSQLCLFVSSMWEIIKRSRAEIRAQAYLDLAPAIFLALDINGNITLLNEYGYKLLGCTDKKCLGINWFDNFVSKDNRDSVKSIFKSLTSGETDFVDFENVINTFDNHEKIILWKNSALRDSSGVIIGTLSAGDDVTNERLAEQELERYWLRQERVLAEKLGDISLLNNTHST